MAGGADAPPDRRRARPLHRRPADAKRAVAIALRNRWRRQKLPRRHARRDHSEEHHHDRAHRRRQDRDRAPPGQAGRCAVPQGRGDEVHRGRLRRPRRRVDGPRPGRDSRSSMVRDEREDDVYAQAEARAEERLLDLLLPPRAGTPRPRPGPQAGDRRRPERTLFVVSPKADVTERGGRRGRGAERAPRAHARRSSASAAERRDSSTSARRDRGDAGVVPRVRLSSSSRASRRGRHQHEGQAAGDVPQAQEAALVHVPEARRILPTRSCASWSTWTTS